MPDRARAPESLGSAVAYLDALPVGLAVIEAPGTISWANRAYFEISGRDAATLGLDFHQILDEDGSWAAPIRTAVDDALRDGRAATFRSVRARYRHTPGGTFLDVDVQRVPGADRGPARALLLIRDVTDRERERVRSQLFYEAFRTSTNPMQLTDVRGIMVDVNPAFERIYGYTRAECLGRKPNLVRSRHTPPEVYEAMWKDLADPARGYWAGEILNRDRRGRERPVLLSITGIRDARGDVTNYLGVAVDLSEQRAWELKSAHSDKLASVGQLAAGVAHEVNTPLANLMLITESLRRKTDDPWVRSRLETMAEQIEVAARIVRGLLDFARREEPQIAEVDLADVARDAIGFLRGKQSPDVEIAEEFPSEPVRVAGDRGQLRQVVTNLLTNAYDAMHGRGTIRVTVRRRGARAELEVVDTGPGIPPEVLPHVFEPFFTTKPEGEGTGLGLAICHGIVLSHHGSISARNVPGAGAEFVISLPPAAGSPGPAGAPKA